jgi:hypothetical protein
MIRSYRLSGGDPSSEQPLHGGASLANASGRLLPVVASVNADAIKTWAALWKELKPGVTPAGPVLPDMERGFVPACGWPEFLEKLWLLKHYLDCTGHVCQEAREESIRP